MSGPEKERDASTVTQGRAAPGQDTLPHEGRWMPDGGMIGCCGSVSSASLSTPTPTPPSISLALGERLSLKEVEWQVGRSKIFWGQQWG